MFIHRINMLIAKHDNAPGIADSGFDTTFTCFPRKQPENRFSITGINRDFRTKELHPGHFSGTAFLGYEVDKSKANAIKL